MCGEGLLPLEITTLHLFRVLMAWLYTVEPLYYVHPRDHKKCPDYRGVLISEVVLYIHTVSLCSWERGQCPDYRGVLISEVVLSACLCSWDCGQCPH